MLLAKARELGKAIRESEAAKKLQQCQTRLALDPTAQQILRELQEWQQKLQIAQLRGVPPTAEEQAAIRTLELRLQSNDTMKQLLQAQDEFNLLLEQVNQAIFEGIEGREGPAPNGPSGGAGDPRPGLIFP